MATITKRGKSYLIRVSDGFKSDHSRNRPFITYTPEPGMTQKQIDKEVLRQATLFEERVKTGRVVDGNIKFSDYADIWIKDYAEKQLEPKTLYRYKQLLKRIKDSIGNIRLDKLQPHHLLEFYNNLEEDNIREDVSFVALPVVTEAIENKARYHAEFARLAGVAPNTILAVFKGKPIREKSMKAICKSLGMKPTESFTKSDKSTRLSSRTILHHHRLLSSMLTTAVEWQIIFDNPAHRVRAPRAGRLESKYLDEEQSKLVIDLLKNEPIQYRTMITLLLYSGLRRGELCGLIWDDIDFDNHVINVQRASQYLPGRGIFDKVTKTASSARSIKLSSIAFSLLQQYRAWQNVEKLKIADIWVDTGKLFTKWNGEAMHPDSISGWFEGFVKKNNLPHVSIHSLRHTNATLLIAGGTNIRTVSNRLGHSQTSTTSNIYAHAIRSADEAAAETIENLLDPNKKKGAKAQAAASAK